jgi:hypothetical protein
VVKFKLEGPPTHVPFRTASIVFSKPAVRDCYPHEKQQKLSLAALVPKSIWNPVIFRGASTIFILGLFQASSEDIKQFH